MKLTLTPQWYEDKGSEPGNRNPDVHVCSCLWRLWNYVSPVAVTSARRVWLPQCLRYHPEDNHMRSENKSSVCYHCSKIHFFQNNDQKQLCVFDSGTAQVILRASPWRWTAAWQRGCTLTYTCARSTCPDRISLHTKNTQTHWVRLTLHVGQHKHVQRWDSGVYISTTNNFLLKLFSILHTWESLAPAL